MAIYNPNSNWRKVYVKFYGPIPKDQNGRSYDIHHIDGNRKNNHPSNLIAVPIEKHFDIHYQQGDYGACLCIARRMKKSAQELSELAREAALQKVADGTHPWLGDKNPGRMRSKDGTHHWFGPENNQNRIKNGTHPWLGGDVQRKVQSKRLSEGTHNFLDGSISQKRQKELVKDGNHHFLDKVQAKHRTKKIIASGRHSCQIQRSCPHCGTAGKGPALYKWHFDRCKHNPNL